MMNYRVIAPAGAPIPVSAVISSLSPRTVRTNSLEEILKRYLGVQHLFSLSSGRAALTVLFEGLKKCSDRREVIIPAYTCFSVPSAVVRAGLRIRLCDVDPKTLDLDYDTLLRMDLGKVLCIVPSGLCGMPSDLVILEEVARTYGAFLVDDAAQCLGAAVGGRLCGTFGDAGFFSLGRGKNITAMGGGILLVHDEYLAFLIRQEVYRLPHPSAQHVFSAAMSSLVYAAMLRPSRYWALEHVPFLGLGLSRFDPNFEVGHLSRYQERLAARMLGLLDTYNDMRLQNAELLQAGIEGIEGIEIPRPVKGAIPVYLRFPILARDGVHRSKLLKGLWRAGIGASTSYPTSIGDIPGIVRHIARDQHPCPGAIEVASRIITLPTHPYVTSGDIDRMVEIVRGS
jgi:perosamine synthetase